MADRGMGDKRVIDLKLLYGETAKLEEPAGQ
jgi:hypothetical protein